MEMGLQFVLQNLIANEGKIALTDAARCKSLLPQYAQSDFKRERGLIVKAAEAGVAREIEIAEDFATAREAQILMLREKCSMSENDAVWTIALLAALLRADKGQIANKPQDAAIAMEQTSQPESEQIPYATFTDRLIAMLIDCLILLPILVAITTVWISAYGVREYAANKDELENYMKLCLHILCFVWVIFFWSKWQATPGKKKLKIKIVNAKTLGKPSAGQLVGRYFAYILSTLPFLLGYFWVIFDKQKRAFHDILAGTLVIKEG
ncbi:MAG: RDD family protein [Helicobacteraceae bacterium]|jgi:uncharacterized RDD family membrane protein YckC|nr:RDD family protein [Helicobacteraceae bacterium]